MSAMDSSIKKRQNPGATVGEFIELAGPLLNHEQVLLLGTFIHHRQTSCLSHCLAVAWTSYRVAARLGLNRGSTIRGALLHDLFWYDWLTQGPRLHGFRHPGIALGNALVRFRLNAIERDIIARHMWPLTPTPPRYLESWIVCIVDTLVGLFDYLPVSFAQYPDELRAIAGGWRERVPS